MRVSEQLSDQLICKGITISYSLQILLSIFRRIAHFSERTKYASNQQIITFDTPQFTVCKFQGIQSYDLLQFRIHIIKSHTQTISDELKIYFLPDTMSLRALMANRATENKNPIG